MIFSQNKNFQFNNIQDRCSGFLHYFYFFAFRKLHQSISLVNSIQRATLGTAQANQINYESEFQALESFSQGLAQNRTFTPLEVEKALNNNYWKLLKTMILDYFNPKNIDLFPVFTQYRKKVKKEDFPSYENLVGLLPLESPSLHKYEAKFAQSNFYLFP